MKFYRADYSFKMECYLGILCEGIHKSQRGLREVGVGTVCDQTRCPTNQGFMREVFNLLEVKGMLLLYTCLNNSKEQDLIPFIFIFENDSYELVLFSESEAYQSTSVVRVRD